MKTKIMTWLLVVSTVSIFGVVQFYDNASMKGFFFTAIDISFILLIIVLAKHFIAWHKEIMERKTFEINFSLRRRVE